MKKRIIIIGGGFGGLAAACRLASHGHDVEIIEKRDQLGGSAYVYIVNGFKFDGGPTILTSPFMFDEIFSLSGKNRSEYVEYIPCVPSYRVFSTNHRKVIHFNDREMLVNEVNRISPTDGTGFEHFLDNVETIIDKNQNDHSGNFYKRLPASLWPPATRNNQSPEKAIHQLVTHYIKDDFLRQVFTSTPYRAWIPANFKTNETRNLQLNGGTFFPSGGTGALLQAFARLFTELGGTVSLNTEVASIIGDGQGVSGVRLADGSIRRSDIVISNAGVEYTKRYLLPEPRKLERFKYIFSGTHQGNSLFIIYFGTRRKYQDSGFAHHNIIFTSQGDANKKNHGEDILTGDMTLFLHIPTMTDPSIAPRGRECFIVATPVPDLKTNIDWQKMARPFRDRIMDFLEKNYLPDLRVNIVAEHYIDPPHFQKTLNRLDGVVSTIENPKFGSNKHHATTSRVYKNLYHVGEDIQPGSGLSGALASAAEVEKIIQASS